MNPQSRQGRIKMTLNSNIKKFNKFLADNFGIYFPKERYKELLIGLKRAAYSSGEPFNEEYIYRLLSQKPEKHQLQKLINFLTNGETYFFREARTLEVVKTRIIPQILEKQQNDSSHLRIWSAGCSTGEEPYTIAIILKEILPPNKPWRLDLIATDINQKFLEKAKIGVYSNWSFRGTPEYIKEKYFTKIDDKHYQISEEIRSKVTFRLFNLAEKDWHKIFPEIIPMDLIFCRNVLIHFNKNIVNKIIDKFFEVLVSGGWLILGSAESSFVSNKKSKCLPFPGLPIFQKANHIVQLKPSNPLNLNFHSKRDSNPTSQKISLQHKFKDNHDPKKPFLPIYSQPSQIQKRKFSSELNKNLADKEKFCDPLNFLEKELKTKSKLDIQDYDRIIILTKALANRGAFEKAGWWCKKCLEINKIDPKAHYLMAIILQEMQDFSGAKEALQKALFLQPDHIMAQFTLATLLMKEGQFGEAEKLLKSIISQLSELSPDFEIPDSDNLTAKELLEISKTMV